ncbi:MAG: hypothetical protein O2887_11665 [Bacteroidetes bacterium]|nr:hypothetical protein [Bacteroidota bacterium]MDA1121128.1 hypothetical protein [Bacteroidota bacterium]
MGLLLHDILFAPFFAGSAGAGMIWHWIPYVHANNLWFQYGRFSNAIDGIDPIKEGFEPVFNETERLRIYTLKGKSTTLIWLRDKRNDWETELDEGIPPEIVTLSKEDMIDIIPSSYSSVEIYDPWVNKWSEDYSPERLSEGVNFYRSLVLKVAL